MANAIVPYRLQIKNLSAPWLREGTGERMMYVFGAMVDARAEKTLQGTNAGMPTRAQDDALNVLGADMLIPRGLTEQRISYGARVQGALDAHRNGGTARGVLSQALGYLLALTPMVRMVWTRYGPDPARMPGLLALVLGSAITDATNVSPIVITCPAHGFVTGDAVTVSGVLGNTAANGAWTVTVVDSSTFSLNTSTGSGAYTSGGRAILTSAIPSTAYPPTRYSSTWNTYPVARDPTSEPVTTYCLASGNGDWTWDETSPITGSWGWWSSCLILYSVAPNNWCNVAQDWGTGSTYTPGSAAPYYSDVSGGAYVLSGSYTGSSQAWGAGSTYVAASSGYYSTVSNGAYAIAGEYLGVSQAWGVDVTTDVGGSIVIIARQFISANTWVRAIIVSFDATLFDPAQPAGGGINPDGNFGQWSIVSGGAYAESRFTSAVYGGEVTV